MTAKSVAKNKTKKPYYLGLDIGTDSIGYAVCDESYRLLRFKGKSMWGSGLFDEATASEARRAFRTARRRLDRRQQRVRLLREFFAASIAAVDPKFFVRLKESALFAEDRSDPLDNQTLFNDPSFKDTDFHRTYPTIHHLIVDLMTNPAPHDPRLVYIACAWLIAHRGHFLTEVSLENVSSLDDVSSLYDDLMNYMADDVESEDGETAEFSPMWSCDAQAFGEILAKKTGLSRKREMMLELLWDGKKPKSDDARFNRFDVISLLCGSETVKPYSLFKENESYKELAPLSLAAEDEKLAAQIAELGDDGELIRKLKALYDWAVLREVRQGAESISAAKVAVYEQHREDLKNLKAFLRKTDKKLFRRVFKLADEKMPNYKAYVYNPTEGESVKKAKKEVFSEWLAKELKGIVPAAEDRVFFDDMMARLETCSFLPKQIDGDNRVIPHQLYQVELRVILKNASEYLPFLKVSDEFGSVAEKIDSIFGFRVPYFVGPLVSHDEDRGKFAWMERRKDGVIRPWNFTEIVDLDKSEDAFIRRMTNVCTYLPGEDVLPEESLLYREFTLLNEINPLKIAGAEVSPDVKRQIVDGLFKKKKKVTAAALRKFLVQENLMREGDAISGIDETIKSSLSSFHAFRRWLDNGKLTDDDVESIILRSTCTEDTSRLKSWIARQPFAVRLDELDVRAIARLKFAEFGRLSRHFLEGVEFVSKATGEKNTVIGFMRDENVVLMELLSDRYTLSEELQRWADEYYAAHETTMESRLDELYVSSAVKRQIYRAMDIVKTIKKVQGAAPKKIFVEMARGGTPDQKGKRTKSRYDQLVDLYRGVRDVEVKAVNAELEKMGDGAHNRLQADALYLWHLQLGHCAYCGKPLPVEGLKSVANIDHIHPQSKVKDDSVMNNKVLCCSTCNDHKKDLYPVPNDLRQETLWTHWHKLGLMTPEKYRRLMRREPLNDEELQGFINRQLVETRQTTKAVLTVLKERLPETEIIAVKAGNVSDFRHEFGLVKSRAVNDLHHAKDAYLNIVVGNVYHERFTRRFFRLSDGYTMKIGKLFGEGSHVENANGVAWKGVESLRRVKETMARNDIHLTKYAFYAKGGFFEQTRKGPGEGAIPLKKGLDVSRYGGYVKPKAAGFVLVSYVAGKKKELSFIPIDLIDVPTFERANRKEKINLVSGWILSKKTPQNVDLPLGDRILKINTIICADGFRWVLSGKTGSSIVVRSMRPYLPADADQTYIKRLESVAEKMKLNAKLVVDERYDAVSHEKNLKLYDSLCKTLSSPIFAGMPSSQADTLSKGRGLFERLDVKDQIRAILEILKLIKTNRASECDLKGVGGSGQAGKLTPSANLSNWKKGHQDVRIIDVDFSGLFETSSKNLLELV